MSLVWLLSLAKTHEQRYNLIKAIYEIRPNYGELVNMRMYCTSDEDWKIYDETQETLKKLKSQ